MVDLRVSLVDFFAVARPITLKTNFEQSTIGLYFHYRHLCKATMGDSAYSFSLTTFSRTGKLLQIEYALNAVANGRTSLGICAKDGVVIATDKKLSSTLVDTDDVSKVESINQGCGFVYSGVGPDYRVLGEKCHSGVAMRRKNHFHHFKLIFLFTT